MAGSFPRALLGLALLALLAYGGCALWRGLASDETRIRRQIEAMAEAFNDGEVLPIVQRLHARFHEQESGADLESARLGLAWFFQEHRDPSSGALRYRVEVDGVQVVLDPEQEGLAQAECRAVFFDTAAPQHLPVWEVQVESRWQKDGGWRCTSARLETRAGRSLMR